eukprot:3404276-Pleurochrysis_carterae.AAC.1
MEIQIQASEHARKQASEHASVLAPSQPVKLPTALSRRQRAAEHARDDAALCVSHSRPADGCASGRTQRFVGKQDDAQSGRWTTRGLGVGRSADW